LFLREFVEDVPWVHLDIAGPAFLSAEDGYSPKGGTGFGVRTLAELAATFEPPPPPDTDDGRLSGRAPARRGRSRAGGSTGRTRRGRSAARARRRSGIRGRAGTAAYGTTGRARRTREGGPPGDHRARGGA